MRKGPIKNMAASVRQRLADVAHRTNRPFSDVLQHYALERWLYRLSQSEYRERFILKGALLFIVWNTPGTRSTRDIDLLARVSNDPGAIRTIIMEICQAKIDDDGLIFDAARVATHRIVEAADYEGVRVRFPAKLGNARIAMQIDVGFGDVITPGPDDVNYPTIIGLPAPELRAYNRETAIAEKFEAMVKLGELNSRMKDFFDIAVLAANFEFDGAALAAAVRATFDRRGSELEGDPICFSDGFATEPAKAAQWHAFVKRSRLIDAPADFLAAVEQVRSFLQPVARRLAARENFGGYWPRGGAW